MSFLPYLNGDLTASEQLDEASWCRFLDTEVEATKEAYRAKPSLILRDFNAEKATSQDYAERELLELVQNAADAATEAGGNGKVRIEIGKNGLIVANTGQPFRSTGIRSLMTSHLSDKPQRGRALIGAKGLGFRSILNWTTEPIVMTGSLKLAFSNRHSASVISALKAETPAIADELERSGSDVAPILPFPIYGEAFEQEFGSAASDEFYQSAVKLKNDGYQTVIAARFASAVHLERASAQAIDFRPEFLLFVPSLTSVEISVEGKIDQSWRKERVSGDTWKLIVAAGYEVSEQTWICRHDTGLSPGLQDGEPETNARFEATVAIRVDKPNTYGMLHCFFPTSVIMPLPGLFHATFEVASNRKQLRDGSLANEYVLQHLAELYVRTIADLVAADRMKAPLFFLAGSGEYPPVLKPFESALYAAAQIYSIIPTLDGSFVSAPDTHIGPDGCASFLPPRLFPKSASYANARERAFLRSIGVIQLDTAITLNKLADLELRLEERADLIVGLVKHNVTFADARRFLIDENDRRFEKKNSCFPPPIGQKMPALPRWAQRRFMHAGLWDLISERLALPRREIIPKLRVFNVEDYNLEGIARSLVRQAEVLVTRSPGREDVVRTETLQTLQRLFLRESEGRARFPQLHVRVRTESGSWRSAEEVHLSNGYCLEGRINQALYSPFPDLLLETPNTTSYTAQDLDAFYEWIGVNRWPRIVSQDTPVSMRKPILESLPEEFTVSDGSTFQTIRRDDVTWTYNARFKMQTIERLEEVLATAASDAILAWIARDPRFNALPPFSFSMKLEARKSNSNFRPYSGISPDPVRWMIRNKAWLSCSDGTRRPPSEAMRDASRLRGIFTQPTRPNEESLQRFGLDDTAWARALVTAGVPTNVDDLSEAQIFTLLIKLKDKQLDHDVVRRLYVQILEREVFRAENASVERDRFEREGRVQCRLKGEFVWVKASAAFYADRDGLLATARDQLALIDLPTRRSAANVGIRFCVAPLSRQGLTVRVASEVGAHQATDLIAHRFRAAQPFLRAYRSLIAPDASSNRRFDRLSVEAVLKLSIEIELSGAKFSGELPAWSHLIDEDRLIVIVDDILDVQQLLSLACEAIGDGLADIFEVQNGADFTKLLSQQQDSTRLILLQRMLPNFSGSEIEALFEDAPPAADPVKFDLALLDFPPPASLQSTSTWPGKDTVPLNESVAQLTEAPVEDPPRSEDTSTGDVSDSPRVPAAVTAEAMSNPPASTTGKRVDIRVGYGGGYHGSGSSQDADHFKAADAEDWAILFERSQGRFPLKVAHLQGSMAFGCDVLSFHNQAQLDFFKSDGDRRRILRFIEVKSGSVRLTENETPLRAARKLAFFHLSRHVSGFISEDGDAYLRTGSIASRISSRTGAEHRYRRGYRPDDF
ncbi:sacsin N-terminal ATP-binding-like domain-containing protein [Agrobacterium rosae]|uniref:Protein NO VEIN C-terminal domain-containing protein n=1 Tax=Agrobacterium rosae TaxID=1972867 RepID=A0A1R3U280_9HYPH|nr:hypothetical protein [Agrobacterium rosae]SCX31945.1 hypothetical protein DSM25559_3835 [Agrobacterium rosae]